MAPFLSIRTEGFKEVDRALSVLARPGSDPVFRRALKRSAEEVQETTQVQLKGVLLEKRSGALHDSIVIRSRRPRDWVEIGSPLPQAPPLHWGWPARNIRPSPFLTVGLRNAKRAFRKIWVEELSRELQGGLRVRQGVIGLPS